LPDARESFCGTVLVYGSPVYINTATGQGVGEVLHRMSGFIEAFGGWGVRDGAVERDDLRQEAYAATLEGMRAYDPSRKTQLSTFLQRHVRNRMVDVCRRSRPSERFEGDVPAGPDRVEDRMDARRALARWGERWGRIMVSIFVEGRSISEVAEHEGMTPWGLSRAIKRRVEAIRKDFDV
jgi:RNA polymerase sigma factor (sigma-70 family)